MKVMVALRPGETESAGLQRALLLAEQTDVELLLFSAVYNEYLPGIRFGADDEMNRLHGQMMDNERDALRTRAKELAECFAAVTTEVRWQFPTSEAITQMAADYGAELLIISAGDHSSLARLFINNTDWEVMRSATMPVLIARTETAQPYQKIMVAVDPTHPHDEPAALDYKLIDSAKLIAGSDACEVFLAHAYPPIEALVSADYVPGAAEVAQIQRQNKQATRFLAEQTGIDESHVLLEGAMPRWGLPRMAAALPADLVVIGSISRSFLSRLLIGKTTEAVLGKLDCDVLVVGAGAP